MIFHPSMIVKRLARITMPEPKHQVVLEQIKWTMPKYLLLNKEGYPGDIARKTGYTQKSAQDTMAEMATSGFLHQTKKGREGQGPASSATMPWQFSPLGENWWRGPESNW